MHPHIFMPLANSTNDIVHKLFSQVENLLVDMGLMLIEEHYIDTTKMESVVNKYIFVWGKTVDNNKAKLEKKIKNILSQID